MGRHVVEVCVVAAADRALGRRVRRRRAGRPIPRAVVERAELREVPRAGREQQRGVALGLDRDVCAHREPRVALDHGVRERVELRQHPPLEGELRLDRRAGARELGQPHGLGEALVELGDVVEQERRVGAVPVRRDEV